MKALVLTITAATLFCLYILSPFLALLHRIPVAQ